MKIMKPILKNAVEDTITSEMDFDHVKRLQEVQAENAKVNAFNPREIKYLDARSCCWWRKRKYYFSYGDRFKLHIDNCIDIGLLNSILLPNVLFGGFLVLWALRLDGKIGLNWFVITIPIWFIIIPVAILTILHGITSQNKSVTLFEKIVISCLVPIGFTTSYILILWRLENYTDASLLLLLIPNFISVFAFYLYTRQLRTGKVMPKPEDSKEPERRSNQEN